MTEQGADPSFEDVLLQAFLPSSHRSPALAAQFRRLVCEAQSGPVRQHGVLDRLFFLALHELRSLEGALAEESAKRLRALAPRRLLGNLPGLLFQRSRRAQAAGEGKAERSSTCAVAAHASGQLAPHAGGAPRSSTAMRRAASRRVARPLRRSRDEVVAQYGEPSGWQLAGRGSSKDVFYAHCRTPLLLPDGSSRRGLVAIAVGQQSERMRLEIEHLQWVRETLAGDARAAGRVTLPLDSWEMEPEAALLPGAAGGPGSVGARASVGSAADGNADEVAPAGPERTVLGRGPGLVCVVFPAGISLLKLMQRGVTASWSEGHFASLAYEMLLPVAALTEHGAAHRDLKPENTLLLPPTDPAARRAGRRRAAPQLRSPERKASAAAAAPARADLVAAPAACGLPRLRLLLADWSTLRVSERSEYEPSDPFDRPLLGTTGYQHFSFFTSPYLGPPWHPKQWDPSSAECRDAFAVGMTVTVCALGSYLCDAAPRPSAAVLRRIRQFVRHNAYASGEAAQEVAAREVAAQWLHLHAFEQLSASRVLDGLSAHEIAEFRWLCHTSEVRAELVQRLGAPLCALTLQLLSGNASAALALEHAAFTELREADERPAPRSAEARQTLAGKRLRRAGARPRLLAGAYGRCDWGGGRAGCGCGYDGSFREALPEALAELLGIAVIEVVTVTAAVCSTVCTRVPLAGVAARAIAPFARRAGLDTLGCRALELTGVSLREVACAINGGVEAGCPAQIAC